VALTAVEKCAGKLFREGAMRVLDHAWDDSPDSMPCSEKISFFRHPCVAVKGRTRAIQLKDMTLTSPEIWVCWNEVDEMFEALTPVQAQQRLETGEVAEYEQVLAGKFTFTWKRGECGHCHQVAMSRAGELRDVRPTNKIQQGDLGQQPPGPPSIAALNREVGLA
jgi:hypothetical protein